MEATIYRRSLNRERASEWQRRLPVKRPRRKPVHRFESCRSHALTTKRAGGRCLPSTPNGWGTGLLNRSESVRARPAALVHRMRGGHKL